VASLVELPLNNGERLSTARKPLGLYFIDQEHFTEEAVEVRYPLVEQRVRLCHWVFVKLHDLEVGRNQRWVNP
jgi:hypothetical protein